MPLNTLRLNHAPSSHPNSFITFIKPLPNLPTTAHAETYLYAISAIILPIMKQFHLAVTTLEEHEPNREFVGRNFNNGEIIQLVLRNRGDRWLPFRQVQMVMMHELAHNVQMNHGKAFWVERNRFAGELRALWGKGYTGDGLWGSGRTLEDAGIVEGSAVSVGDGGDGVENLCGGTYRSRRRKKKRAQGPDLTWKEKRDRRIEKKFGKNGVALGEDEDKRLLLELSKRGPIGGKPRVANSKRGRELRAAAALKRFGDKKLEEEQQNLKEEEDENVADSQDEYEEDDTTVGEVATDRNGQRLLDSMGFGLVKVCGDEDADDVNVKKEQEELDDISGSLSRIPQHSNPTASSSSTSTAKSQAISRNTSSPSNPPINKSPPKPNKSPPTDPSPPHKRNYNNNSPSTNTITVPTSTSLITCPLCTLANAPHALICIVCSCVLQPKKVAGAWRCFRPECAEGNKMINAGDVVVCGACGGRRKEKEKEADGDG